ncbi:peptidylprolyl isomerase [Chloroflexota bacterium]
MKSWQTVLILVLASIMLLSGISCGGGTSPAKDGDVVRVHYTGTLEDGTEFDSSVGRDPVEFTVGSDRMIRGFDRALVGMKPGESKTVTIPTEEAYGPPREELIGVVERSELPEDIEPEVGMLLQSTGPNGEIINLIVTDVSDTTVTLDANHMLAGKTLIFTIELVEIL